MGAPTKKCELCGHPIREPVKRDQFERYVCKDGKGCARRRRKAS